MGPSTFVKTTAQRHGFSAEDLLFHLVIKVPVLFHVNSSRLRLLQRGLSVLRDLVIKSLPYVKLDAPVLLVLRDEGLHSSPSVLTRATACVGRCTNSHRFSGVSLQFLAQQDLVEAVRFG